MKNGTAPSKLANRCLHFIVTCGFIGCLPGAPGTYASILACTIFYFFPVTPLFWSIIVVCLITVASVICINNFAYDGEDPSYIVIDEFAGMFVTMAGHEPTVFNLLTGFIFFRLFDILKPYPIRRIERLKVGYGVVADDVLAGIFANLMLYLCIFIYGRF